MMSGADELDALSHELEEFAHSDDVTAHGGLKRGGAPDGAVAGAEREALPAGHPRPGCGAIDHVTANAGTTLRSRIGRDRCGWPADLDGAFLMAADLRNANLRHADLSNRDLRATPTWRARI
ncbi:MAG: pentapeptide repeat-containing protein [Caldilineaceae bacterium]